MSDGVIATDRRGNITIINETASDFMDVTAEKAIGNSILDILKIRDDYSLRDLIENQDELMLDFSSNERVTCCDGLGTGNCNHYCPGNNSSNRRNEAADATNCPW
ncbi:hypothetical protein WP50_12930 [Lactiplantibacillus plantarum]|nr:hypothetical protein WP50_12930 [Lactiplantibacillus plantarum]